VTPLYQEQINANPSLGRSNRKAIDFGLPILYVYKHHGKEKDTFYYKTGLDLAGNIARLATNRIWKKEIL
jgi:nitrogenase molybdenum-iron protein alpha/beta subunit